MLDIYSDFIGILDDYWKDHPVEGTPSKEEKIPFPPSEDDAYISRVLLKWLFIGDEWNMDVKKELNRHNYSVGMHEGNPYIMKDYKVLNF